MVTKVDKGWAADRAGLKEGDLILSWSQGETINAINSPLDLKRAYGLQREGDEITLRGLRGPQEQNWRLPADWWGLETRANFEGAFLSEYLRGQKLANSGHFADAAQAWRQMMPALENDCLRSWLLLQTAKAASSARLWNDADTAYAQALKEEACLDALTTADILEERSYNSRSKGDLAERKLHLEQALMEVDRKPRQNIRHAAILTDLGLLALDRGDPKGAQPYLSGALEEMQSLVPSSGLLPGFLVNFGAALYTAGDLQQAEDIYEKALEKSKQAPGQNGRGQAMVGICAVAQKRDDLERAESYCSQVAAEWKARYSAGYGDCLVQLSTIANERGDWNNAGALLRRALTIHRKLSDPLRLAEDLVGLGLVAEGEGDLVKATSLHMQALAIERRVVPDSVYVANTLVNLCQIVRKRGNLDQAQHYCREALAVHERFSSGDVNHAEILKDLGDVARDRGDVALATDNYLAAVRIYETLAPWRYYFVEALAALAKLSRNQGQMDAAANYYQRALEAAENRTARLGGSSDVRAGARAQSEGIYRDYIDLLIARNEPQVAFSFLERSRGRILLEMLAAAHVDIRTGADLALLEREHALQADITAKSERRIHLLAEKPPGEQIKILEQEIAGLTLEYQGVEEQLRVASPNYASLTQPRPLTAAEIRQQISDPDTLLLEYSLGDAHSHVFAVTSDSLQVFELPARSAVEKAARRAHAFLTARNQEVAGESAAHRVLRWRRADAAYPQAVRELSRMILGPVSGQMKGKRLLIVADGALHYIPFAALPSPEGERTSLEPLAVQHEIINLPSASVLAQLRQEYNHRKPAPQAIAVLADPVFDRNDPRVSSHTGRLLAPAANVRPLGAETRSASAAHLELLTRSAADLGLKRHGEIHLPRLRYSRQEAEAIQAVALPSQVLEAVDFQASRSVATSPALANYRIIHFATHALLNNQHPELSGLVLSLVDEQGGDKDGFLALHDIYNMNLPAELVVLSACETGLGKEIGGEGLIGLTRGFMYAGASRVVASLWKVSDAATAELMAEFYRGMEKDGLSPAAALRSAQVKMWREKRWQSPYYWSAFQIQGEWR